jgi:hypothetical protein
LFNFLCCCAFTFHTRVKFTKTCSMKWAWLSILSLPLIRLFLLYLLIFSAIATKYLLKVWAKICLSVIFLPSTFRACISLLFFFLLIPDSLFIIPHVVLTLLWELRINLLCSFFFLSYNYTQYFRRIFIIRSKSSIFIVL